MMKKSYFLTAGILFTALLITLVFLNIRSNDPRAEYEKELIDM